MCRLREWTLIMDKLVLYLSLTEMLHTQILKKCNCIIKFDGLNVKLFYNNYVNQYTYITKLNEVISNLFTIILMTLILKQHKQHCLCYV